MQSIFLEGSRVVGVRRAADLTDARSSPSSPGSSSRASASTHGRTFAATKVVATCPRRGRGADAARRAADDAARGGGAVPTTDDLTYAPLNELLRRAADAKPDALVLVGPFVDEAYPWRSRRARCPSPSRSSSSGRSSCGSRSSSRADGGRGGRPVVPRLPCRPHPLHRDAAHSPIYPQTALDVPAALVPEHVRPYLHLCSNPTTVRIGGVRLAAGSVDALGQQELARTPVAAPDAPKPDRLARLASHLVQQRHLLPLFPAPLPISNPLPVDVVANVKAAGLRRSPTYSSRHPTSRPLPSSATAASSPSTRAASRARPPAATTRRSASTHRRREEAAPSRRPRRTRRAPTTRRRRPPPPRRSARWRRPRLPWETPPAAAAAPTVVRRGRGWRGRRRVFGALSARRRATRLDTRAFVEIKRI